MPCYRIKDWDAHFEKRHTDKEVVFRWIAVPTKHDGKSFRRLARHPNAVPVFCAWNLMMQVAAKMPVRGLLVDEDGPLTAVDLGDSTGYPAEIFATAFEVLSSEGIGWLESVNDEEGLRQVATSCEKSPYRTGENRREQDKECCEPDRASQPPDVIFPVFDCNPGRRSRDRTWLLTPEKVAEWVEAFPGVDVPAEFRKAWSWCRDNPTKRKTSAGMPRFLFDWLSRTQNSIRPDRNGRQRATASADWSKRPYAPG